jgi:hypothetical protein
MLTLQVHWNQLAKIEELQEYFQEDFKGFKSAIEQFDEENLRKLAYIRVLEVTNGCTQWGFRRQDKESLSLEATQQCMKIVMGFIKNKKVYFPSKGTIVFKPKVEEAMANVRQMYCDAFKRNVPGMKREYYVSSTAQFIVYERRNLESAMACVKQDYEDLFLPYYIQRGQNYIVRYLACIS